MTSPLGEHNLGSHYLLTGYQPTPALDYPSYGAVMAHLRGGQGVLPPYVALPGYNPAAGAGYLPDACRPFAVGGDPAQPGFRVRDLDAFPGVTGLRMARRREYLEALDRFGRSVESAPEETRNPEFEQAYRLITSTEAKRAFDLTEEKSQVRDRYGRKTLGQSCLLARRLIERGVPFVTVNDRGWDTHDNLMTRLQEGYTGAKVGVGLVPTLDLALSALLDDLHERAGSRRRWWSSWASSAAPRNSTPPGAATTGRGSSACSWRAVASRAVRCSVPAIRRERAPPTDPSRPPTSPARSIGSWASIPPTN